MAFFPRTYNNEAAVAIDSDKLYISDDLTNWQYDPSSYCNTALRGHYVNSVTFTEGENSHLYLTMTSSRTDKNRTLVSSDMGKTCEDNNIGDGAWYLSSSPESKIIFAISASQIKRSIDHGITWQAVDFKGDESLAIKSIIGFAFDPKNVDYIYAYGGSEIWYSRDGGVSWGKNSYQGVYNTSSPVLVVNDGKNLLFSNHLDHLSMISTDMTDLKVQNVSIKGEEPKEPYTLWEISAPTADNKHAIISEIYRYGNDYSLRKQRTYIATLN
ncbi:hypothetical protein SOPP22_14320 [Shewanella sp. OPT22]|nr:hypothetical protein SOPP22_14320 [Shewanella sp. OPT22]